MMGKRRSKGVTIFAMILIVFGLWLLFEGTIQPGVGFAKWVDSLIAYHFVLKPLVFSLLFIICGILLFKRKKGAPLMAMLLLGCNIYLGYTVTYTSIYIIGLLIPVSLHCFIGSLFFISPFVIAVYFFTRPKVKEQFACQESSTTDKQEPGIIDYITGADKIETYKRTRSKIEDINKTLNERNDGEKSIYPVRDKI